MTTATSSVPLVTRAALFDELGKIAAAHPAPDKKVQFKKWLKNAALVAAGTGAGTAAFMIADELAGKNLSPAMRTLLRGGAALGGAAAGYKMYEHFNKAMNE